MWQKYAGLTPPTRLPFIPRTRLLAPLRRLLRGREDLEEAPSDVMMVGEDLTEGFPDWSA